jgi:phosphoribosylformylglycinamidine (FGAM) synthase PurS component
MSVIANERHVIANPQGEAIQKKMYGAGLLRRIRSSQ